MRALLVAASWIAAFIALLLPQAACAQGFGEPPPWRIARGEAIALSVAADGSVIAAGRDARLWTWRAADAAWAPIAGSGVRAAAMPGGRFYAIARDGALSVFDGQRLARQQLQALDVSVDGAGNPYAIRADGALVRKAAGADKWEELGAAGARRLAVHPDGSVWLALSDHKIARWVDGKAAPVTGSAREITIGSTGVVMVIDVDGNLQRWNAASSAWEAEQAPARLAVVALGPGDLPWVAAENGVIHTRANLFASGVRIEDTATAGAGINRRAGGGGAGGDASARGWRRAAAFVVNPAAQTTDTSPVEWIDTLNHTGSLAIAQEGSVFALNGDGSVARWSNQQRRFLPYPGLLARIAVDPAGNPWGINPFGRIFRQDGNDWRQVGGTASDLSVGVGGDVFASTITGGLSRFDAAGNSMVPLGGALFAVAVAPDGVPWGLLQDGTVARCPTLTCQRFFRTARNLAIGPDGSVFIVTTDGVLQRLRKTLDDWDIIPVLGQRVLSVAVGPRGRPWVVAESGRVYASAFFPRDESTDQLEAAATTTPTAGTGDTAQVASNTEVIETSKSLTFQSIPVTGNPDGLMLGPDGTVLVINAAGAVRRYDTTRNAFVPVTGLPPGNIRHIKTGQDGRLWVTSADVDGRLFHQISGSTYETIQLPVANPITGLGAGNYNGPTNIGLDGTIYAIDTAGILYRRPAGSGTFTRFVAGTYRNVAIRRAGDIWVIDNNNIVRQIVDGRAERRPANRNMTAIDIAGGQEGTIYITNNTGGQRFPFKWNAASQTWDRVNQAADIVGVAPNGLPWLLNTLAPTRVLRVRPAQ